MSRVFCYQSAMRSAGMFAAQGVLALAVLSLLMSSSSALSHRIGRYPDSCPPEIIGAEADAYKTEHPICSRLAAKTQASTIPVAAAKYWPETDFQRFPRARCAMRGRPMNITLYWSNDPSRAAFALLAVLLRHVYKFQHVHLAPDGTPMSQLHKRDELVIRLAVVVQDEAVKAMRDGLTAFGRSHVPTRRRLHMWLTPATRLMADCQHTNWRFYSNLTALAICGFRGPSSYDLSAVTIGALEIFGVGDDCKETMQKLQQRAAADFIRTLPVFVNRTVIEGYLLTSNHSFLFLDFDIWSGKPGVSIAEPPPCVSDRDDGVCKPELDDSTGMLVTDIDILTDKHLFSLVIDFKPTLESLRLLLEQETNGTNLEEAACEMAEKGNSYVMDELFTKDIPAPLKPASPKTHDKRVPKKCIVVTYLCVADPDNYSYDLIIKSAGIRVFRETPRFLDISFRRYFINCSDTYNMSTKLVDLMERSDALNILGVVTLTVEGAAAASAVAAKYRVPLLLAHSVPDEHPAGNTTWQTAGRLRHIVLALQHFVNESGCTRIAVLSQPTIFARNYFAALQDKAKFFLRDFEIPLDLTERLAMEALRDVRDTHARVIVVNTDSDAATLILAAAVELNMSYMEGFIWIVREPRARLECSTTHFTVSFSKVMEDKAREQQIRDAGEVGQLWPPHSVPLGDALMTVSRGFNNVAQQHTDMLTDLYNDQVIRAFDDSLKDMPVAGFNGVQLNYKNRVLEEVFVYLDELCSKRAKHRRLAMWRVNATSGSVRDKYGGHAFLPLDLGMKCDAGADASDHADVGKQHGTVTYKPANTLNPVFSVHQWIQSITKIETSFSGVSVSDILNSNKLNHLNSNN